VFQRDISRLRFAHKEILNDWQLDGLWSDSQTFGGIRPALCARLPARGATASPLRGFGHLLTVSASRNPVPSRDTAAGSNRDCNYFLAKRLSMRRYAQAGGWGWFSRF